MRERDEAFWTHLAQQASEPDLFATGPGHHDDLAIPALSFLWQLAQRNPYAARLVSGATTRWCDQVSECTLLGLLRRIQGRRDVLQPRFAGLDACWRKLLGPGLSSQAEVRESAHLACLQTLLTEEPTLGSQGMRAAACSSAAPMVTTTDRRRLT